MDSDSNQDGNFQKMFQSLLKKGGNISLAELNASQQQLEQGVSVASESQIRHTVKIIQSNGAPKAELTTGKQVAGRGSGNVPAISLLTKKKGESSIMGYRKKSAGGNKRGRPPANQQDPFFHKWKNLKKYVKNTVFMNAAICDEVLRQEEKVSKAREERRFLLRKLLHYQSLADTQTGARSVPGVMLKGPGDEVVPGAGPSGKTGKSKKKSGGAGSAEKAGRQTKEMLESLGVKPKPKKSKVGGGKHVVPPIPLDSIGRPIFPLNIGDLTLHSIGEIVPDRPGFHTSNYIFPIGYCSTRIYASLHSADKQSIYTCKISDGGNGPMFEIVADDESKVFKSRFLSECHCQLLRALNQARGSKVVETVGKGPEFFGLAHPVVQNLIQSCPGAKKCNGYKWVKFEVNKALTIDVMPRASDDPAISYMALKQTLSGGQDQSPSNLRTLLTGAVLDPNLLNT